MCSDCSAYSGHTGVCPQCRKKEFEEERIGKIQEAKSLLWSIVGWAILTVALCWTVIAVLIGGVKIFNRVRRRKETLNRIDYLNAEIAKLDSALTQGRALI
jgi:hypothetical protein